MALIQISLKEIAKLIDLYISSEEISEVKNIKVQDGRLHFTYDAGKLIPNVPLSLKPEDFKKGELIVELKQHLKIPLGTKILKMMNSQIEDIINNWLFSDDPDSEEKCIVEDNYIYIPIDSITDNIWGDFPVKIKDIEIADTDIKLDFKL